MQAQEHKAILTIALLAAFADGSKDDREREQIKRIAQSLAGEPGQAELAQLYQDVLLKRANLDVAAQALSDPQHRQLAYEMAVCVCDADGAANEAERSFLQQLKVALAMGVAETATIERDAEALAAVPLGTDASATPPAVSPAAAGAQAAPNVSAAELDPQILNAAILNGALELLPQSLASMAIIPLQMRLVYRVGQAHGYALDRGRIKEFIAAAGVGLTSQYVEQFGRKLLGGLLGSVAGGVGRGLGRAAAGAAFSFATTYALGQLAKRYYAGGRQMNAALLQQTYQSLLGEARQLQGQYSSQIQERARTIDLSRIVSMVKGV